MCKITSYIEKIDYIHTRLSAPLSPQLNQKSFIANTLKKIIKGEDYEAPKNTRPFDIISTQDVCLAFELIGKNGKNKSDYFIGTGNPVTLLNFFRQFERMLRENKLKKSDDFMSEETKKMFDVNNLFLETGFKSQIDINHIVDTRSIK